MVKVAIIIKNPSGAMHRIEMEDPEGAKGRAVQAKIKELKKEQDCEIVEIKEEKPKRGRGGES